MASKDLIEKVHIKLFDGREIEAEFLKKMENGLLVKNAKDLKTLKLRKHRQTYYTSEILSYEKIEVRATNENLQGNQNGNEHTTIQQDHQENHVHSQRVSIIGRKIAKKSFTDREMENIEKLTTNCVYIVQYDGAYHAAIDDLMQQELIAVNSENAFGRLDLKRPLLAFATNQNVYLFDLLRLGAMKKELKQIFASDFPRKVMHSSAEFADYLNHKENCQLNNVFDTLVRYFYQHYSFGRCSFRHFNCRWFTTVWKNHANTFRSKNSSFHISNFPVTLF